MKRQPNTPAYDTLRADYFRQIAKTHELLNALRYIQALVTGAIQRFEQIDTPPREQP